MSVARSSANRAHRIARGSERQVAVRVLLATDHYPPYIGGAQIQSELLARELRSRGHDVVVATVWQNDVPAVRDDDGIPVYGLRQLRTMPGLELKRRQHHQPPFPDPVTVLELRRLIKRFQPDIVHSYGWFSYSCAAALVRKNTPLLITARDYAYSCANRTLMRDGHDCSGPELAKCLGCAGRHYGRPKGWIAALGVLGTRPLLRNKTAAIHSISEYVQAVIRRDLLDDRRSDSAKHVIHDVIGNVPQESNRRLSDDVRRGYLDLLPSEPFMLFVGALRRVKGIEQLLEAYKLLADPPPLVLIGTREPDSPTEFPPGVRVLTDFPHEAVMAAWELCLFGVLPSLWPEPFGTVVCEAMSRGKPVVATMPGGHTDMVIDGETGLLVSRGDVEALAEAMRTLISDGELRERLGKAARIRAKEFTPERSYPRIERLYLELLKNRTEVSSQDAREA
jgi:glycosyltransferase involved in cell wall biosynthesis